MTHITVKDFQSIGSIDFNIEGFTVIVGKNNIGKSAVIRAIDAALTNQIGDQYIRLGQKSTEVMIERDTLSIQWKKGDKSRYTVNGESFTNLNRAIPKPMIEAGFGTMEIDEQKINPLIAHQFEPLFLLDKRGSVITEVLSAIYNLNRYSTADDLCQKDLKSRKGILKTRELDIKALQAKIEQFKDFDDIKATVEKLAEEEKTCDELKREIAELQTFETSLNDLIQSIKVLKPIESVKVPQYEACEKLLAEYSWLQECERTLSNLTNLVGNLKPIESLSIPDQVICEGLITEHIWLQTKEQELNSLIKTTNEFKSVNLVKIPEIADIESLFESWTYLESMEWSIGKLVRGLDDESKLIEYLRTLNLEQITGDIENQITEHGQISVIEKNFISIATMAKGSREELKTLAVSLETKQTELASFKACPTCERPL